MSRPLWPHRAARIWLAAALLLLVFPLRRWIAAPSHRLLTLPATPVDHNDREAARQWLFLWQARAFVPPGSSYTVLGPSPDVEMNLFMISLGLFPRAQGLPSSYYGVPAPEVGGQARYVLAFRRAAPPGLELRRSLDEGAVYERPAATK